MSQQCQFILWFTIITLKYFKLCLLYYYKLSSLFYLLYLKRKMILSTIRIKIIQRILYLNDHWTIHYRERENKFQRQFICSYERLNTHYINKSLFLWQLRYHVFIHKGPLYVILHLAHPSNSCKPLCFVFYPKESIFHKIFSFLICFDRTRSWSNFTARWWYLVKKGKFK